MKFAWIDLRSVPKAQREAVIDAAIHSRLGGIVTDDPGLLEILPPTISRVLIAGPDLPQPAAGKGTGKAGDKPARPYDLVLHPVTDPAQLGGLAPAAGAMVDVHDDPSLRLACAAAVARPFTLVRFADPTKIPLEIVLAAADRSTGKLVTAVADLEEARIVLDVLERGSDGLLLAPRDAGEVSALARLLTTDAPSLSLATLVVDSIAHHGLGDRVCVDTCSNFAEDEGILVGSYSSGFILCCSETHPLPYMPTRPFRVNAGALHSYVLGEDNRTNYLSELRSGSTVLAVGADGRVRRVVVGRAKLESRPLLTISAHSADGTAVSLTVQDDWHVRVLAPGGKVRNVTELAPGDELLGYLATDQRHVGLPIGEFCRGDLMDIGLLTTELMSRHDDDLPYLTYDRDGVTRGDLRRSVASEAALFRALGVTSGSTVALQAPPSFTQVEAMLALWQLDAQVILIDHRLKPAEVEALHAMCRPQFLVRAAAAGRALHTRPEYELITESRPAAPPATTGHRLVQFSSGSTGVPKAIGRTTGSLHTELTRLTGLPGMPVRGERMLLLSSTVHSFGLVAGLLHALHVGAEVVFTPRLSARDILATAQRHRVHAVFGVPFHYELLSTTGAVPDLPDLRVAVSGGEAMPAAVAERFAERYGLRVGESYGTTETGMVAMDAGGTLRPAVGPPLPGVTIRIRDGELDVRLPESPYLYGTGGDRHTDGWLHTRDRATVGESGAIRLGGRSDSLVVVGGLKVDLTEIEAALLGHPRVDEAILVYGDVIEAYVSAATGPPLTSGEVLRWCRTRLADHKLPRLIRVLPQLPRTANGKLVREPAALRAAAV